MPPRRKSAPVKAAVVLASEPAAGVDDSSAEVRLIGEIRAALKRHDDRIVLHVDEHVRRFGLTGQFTQERMVYQTEALCGLGRAAEARQVMAKLLARWPDSPHATRVRSSCAGS